MQPTNTRDARVTASLKLLCNGFKSDFAEFIYSDDRFTELVHQLAGEFVEQNVPVVEEQHQLDLAFLLMETVKLSSY